MPSLEPLKAASTAFPSSRPIAILRRVRYWAAVLLTLVVAAEITSRVDDRIRSGVPILAVPDHTRDLVLHDGGVIRGRPNGRFHRWVLNRYGFRSPDTTPLPAGGCTRVMALGASETFGLYESEGKEYPAQLNDALSASGACYEVLNAAVAGLTVRGIVRLWTGWAASFGAAIVVIYPTPAFYLAPTPPGYPRPSGPVDPAPWFWPPRLLQRAQDRFDIPDFVQRRRVALTVARHRQSHPRDWFFARVPPERLSQFQSDLELLVDAIRGAGAVPVLMTHATGFSRPPASGDSVALAAWEQLVPRAASGAILLNFEDRANEAIRRVALNRDAGLVDAAATLNGQPRWFAEDFIHFNDDGAHEVARLIAARVLTVPTLLSSVRR
jgi:lysophospholipase L1-like esterase